MADSKRVMMKLGDYAFSVSTAAYQELARVTEHRWVKQDRIDNRPVYQYVGIGEETIRLPGVIYPHYKGGLEQVQAMRTQASVGDPYLLIDSLGGIHGRWAIRRIEERTSAYLAGGIPRRIDFTLELVYIDNGRQK